MKPAHLLATSLVLIVPASALAAEAPPESGPASMPADAAALTGAPESMPASAPVPLPLGPESAPATKDGAAKKKTPLASLKDAVIIDPPVASGAPGEKRFVALRGKAVSASLGAALQVRLASTREAPGITLGLTRVFLDIQAEELLNLSLHLQLELSPLINEPIGIPAAVSAGPSEALPPGRRVHLVLLASAAVGNLGYLKIGQMKAPFSGEALRDKSNLLTAERSWAVRTLAPFRDVGVAYGSDFHGYGIPVAAEVGVFNGAGPSSLEELDNLLGPPGSSATWVRRTSATRRVSNMGSTGPWRRAGSIPSTARPMP